MNDDKDLILSRRGFVRGSTLGLGASLIGAGVARAQSTIGQGIGSGQKPPADLPAKPVGRPEPAFDSPSPQPSPVDQQVGWAVCGLGHYANNYAIPAIAESLHGRMTGLVSGNRAKASKVAKAWGVEDDAIFGYDMKGLKGREDIDVVYVITPNAIHERNVVAAVEAGKHVMCEKPFATHPKSAQRMNDAAKANDRKLMVAYRAHFEPHNVKAKELLGKGEFGDVWYASSDHHRPLDPKAARDQWRMVREIAGGGSLVDIGIYALNGIIWLFDETPNRLVAQTFAPKTKDGRFGEVEAIAQVMLEFPSGRRANISSGYVASTKRIDLWGSEAVATLDPATSYEGNQLKVKGKEGAEIPKPRWTSEQQFMGEIDHMSLAVRDGAEISTPGEMGLRDVRIMEAIYTSAERGEWVELEPNGRLA